MEPIRLTDLHGLPKVRDSWSFLYLEDITVDRDTHGLCARNASGEWEIPSAMLLALLLGPGTSITQGAMQVISETAATVVWVGEQGVRTYASGRSATKGASNLLRQVSAWSNHENRIEVVRRMYSLRFGESVAGGSVEELRGREGVRVRDAYARLAASHGVPWSGRSFEAGADKVNHCISWANSCLYGVTAAAIHAMGYMPGLGFIHTGKALSFVYDIADLYKIELGLPVAFEISKTVDGDERAVRHAMRDAFFEGRLLERIPKDLDQLFEGFRPLGEVDYDLPIFQSADWLDP